MCFKFLGENELIDVLWKIKAMTDSELEGMAQKALEHTKKRHTPEHRARFILEHSLT